MVTNPKKEATPPEAEQSAPAPVTSIQKPPAFSLDKFKSKRAASVAGLDNLVDAMTHCSVGQVKDFFRLHPDEENYWSPELCMVPVPIKGMKKDTLHLIDEDLAMDFLPSGKIKRLRLALATKPFDVFFFLEVPSQNLDNNWNITALAACEQAKSLWTQASSRKEEGIEGYKVDSARNQEAFPEPKWPRASLAELIEKTFIGRMITSEDHPALLRLIGAKQNMA
jgi:hypothetical protein